MKGAEKYRLNGRNFVTLASILLGKKKVPPHHGAHSEKTHIPDLERMKNEANDPQVGMPVGSISIDMNKFNNLEPDCSNLYLLPTRNLVLFPGLSMTIGLGREASVAVARYAEHLPCYIGIVCQYNPETETPKAEDVYNIGVFATVLKVIDLPDGTKTALLRAGGRFRILEAHNDASMCGALAAHVEPMKERNAREDKVYKAMIDNVKRLARDVMKKGFDNEDQIPIPDEVPGWLVVNHLCTHMPLPLDTKFTLLAEDSDRQRAMKLLDALQMEQSKLELNQEIMQKTRSQMDDLQRQNFLQQQMEAIRDELYGNDANDADTFAERLEQAQMPDGIKTQIGKEVDKLRRLNPQSPDYSVQYTYLDKVLSLPWGKGRKTTNTFEQAEEQLNSDHYGLEKVKERVIEQIGMFFDNPKGKAPILCLVGPPGVGKTSIGKSVAAAMNRDYQRVSLGGLHDEAELRGHRKTYIGAMPGRVIEAMSRAESCNPVLVLDEIDKIGADYRGDPSAALLEVLDPEQNCHFHDNYIDVDFDLSDVFFIATANSLKNVSRPLLDRMEVIEIPGYLPEEKIEIAKRHLLPDLLKAQGWEKDTLTITDEALGEIIENYTGESGVRQLEKKLQAIIRKKVIAKLRNQPYAGTIEKDEVRALLGTPPFRADRVPDGSKPGVVTGLAWTEIGGAILLAEVSLSSAKAPGKLTITGNLGDVMKESATIAMQWVRANAESLGIDPETMDSRNVHVHFPEGAIPKDGPSAGITMATALVSAFTGKPVRKKLAMTGEITLRGDVLPVGGIREKLLAARRAGVTDVVLCEDNRRDVEDIPEAYMKGLTPHYVRTVSDVLREAFE